MIDLHTHSTASDGSFAPRELVQLAQKKGISCLALTDHNTTKGLPEFLLAAEETSVYPVPGVEISCELEGRELHLLALNLPEAAFGQTETLLTEVLSWAEASKRDLVENLRRAGYAICYEEIQKENPGSVINRAHIAAALKKAGYVPTVKTAFQTLLREDAGYYHPPRRLPAMQALSLIQDVSAISVWAHPFLKLDGKGVRQVLETLAPKGLTGMETFYATYSPEQTKAAMELAETFHLKLSGGSDFHGASKPDIQLGVGRGNLNIPEKIGADLLGNAKSTPQF